MKLRYKILVGVTTILLVLVGALMAALSYTKECPDAAATAALDVAMTAVVYRCYGGPEVLALETFEKPAPGPGEMLIAIKAAGVNPLDWHYMRGSPYFMRLMSGMGAPAETRFGVDFAGIVEAVGANVTKYQPGDAVFGGRTGAFGEYVVVAEDWALGRIPDNVSFEQAAATPIAGVTALQALRDTGKLQAGEKVLVNGSSGGVGTYAVQIAKAMGAEVYGVNSTRNVEMVLGLGADHVFDYKKENYTESGMKFDLIIDMIGNHGPADNRRVMTDDGILVMVGGRKGDWIGPMAGPLKGIVYSKFVDQEFKTFLARFNSEDLTALADMMADGKVKSVIDRTYSLDEVRDAIEYSESGRARGKIILVIDGGPESP